MNHQGRGHRASSTLTLARQAIGLAVLYGIVTAGCSRDTGSSSATAPLRPSAATVVPTAAPAPVSPEAYTGELGAVAADVSAAIARLRGATPETLVGEAAAAASMVEDSGQRLRQIAPPAEFVTNHDLLVTSLGSWAGQITGVGGTFTSGELCTVQAVSATVTTLPGLDAVRSSAAAFGSAGTVLAEALPAPEPLADRRLENGTVLYDPGSGEGELEIENGTDRDAAITLAQAGEAVGSIYVERGANAALSGVPDGTFELFFTSGTDWDETAGAFSRSCTFERFESPAVFSTVETAGGIEYTVYSATLQPVPGGTARASPVPPESFPR
jgi:hypothetical protein